MWKDTLKIVGQYALRGAGIAATGTLMGMGAIGARKAVDWIEGALVKPEEKPANPATPAQNS